MKTIMFIIGLVGKLLLLFSPKKKTTVAEDILLEHNKKIEKWKAEHDKLIKEYKEIISKCHEASLHFVHSLKQGDSVSAHNWNVKRSELHAERDRCWREIVDHQRRKPA